MSIESGRHNIGRTAPFAVGEPYWAGHPHGPRFGSQVLDLKPITRRTAQGERYVDLRTIPSGYRPAAAAPVMVLAQPDHPSIVSAGIVRRATAAPSATVYGTFVTLRVLATWGDDHGLPSLAAWTQRTADQLLTDMHNGRHRTDGSGLAVATVRRVVDLLKLLYEARQVVPDSLSFRPWGARTGSAVAGAGRPLENKTEPLPWSLWAPLVTSAWTFVDCFSLDIIAGVQQLRALRAQPQGPSGRKAEEIVMRWLRHGGVVPLHTGFGRGNATRGEVNFRQLARTVAINPQTFNAAVNCYRPDAVDAVEAVRAEPGRSAFGGLASPTVLVTHKDGTRTPWIDELGVGEVEYVSSALRAACYVIIASLTGMRDGEIQELRRNAETTLDGLPALRSLQHKGRGSEPELRSWWAPEPVLRACRVLAQLSEHPTHLFARDAKNAGSYAPGRDIPRLLDFVNGDPATRPGRGSGLALAPIDSKDAHRVHATSLRRAFAVYATTHAGAELGLGIQLGHAAWRMVSGYASDGRQRAIQHLDATRREVLREQARDLIHSKAPIAGRGAKAILNFRAQVVADPTRAHRIEEVAADVLHLGLTNDCLWNPAASGCGADRPKLADHVCIGVDCSNALYRQAHMPLLEDSIRRIDDFLERPHCDPAQRAAMQRNRAVLASLLRTLNQPSTTSESDATP